MLIVKLNAVQSLALAVLVYFIGTAIRRRVPLLMRFSIPAPVVGGLLFAGLATVLRMNGLIGFEFEESLQRALMIMFFTTIGLGASASFLKKGGRALVIFFSLACGLAVLQNVIGILLAKTMGVNPLYGILAGAVSLMGGLGTAGAFGPEFEAWGLVGGKVSAIACATFGMVAGDLLCGPFGETVIRKFRLPTPGHKRHEPKLDVTPANEESSEITPDSFLSNLGFILAAMAVGAVISADLRSRGFTLPVYIGSMIVAVVIRNGMNLTVYRDKIEDRTIGLLSEISLAMYITMAINGMKLWELVNLALPLLVILAGQVLLMVLFCYLCVFLLMGRDYEAMMLSVGMIGFGMGATPNALINMNTLSRKYGPAPRAFLIVPLVGAFLIDFANALIIMTMGSWLKP
jgi:ESS family glutamate:Na+ symporter